MAVRPLTLRRNADQTLTLRFGRLVEHVSLDGKSKGEIFDYVKYAAISKGVVMPDVEIAELLNAAIQGQ